MSKYIITGLVNGQETPIGIVKTLDSPPHEITIHAIEEIPKGIVDVMVVGLQYYEFSVFSILIEVIDKDRVAHHFLLDSWTALDLVGKALHPLTVDNPYLNFNEYVRKQFLNY